MTDLAHLGMRFSNEGLDQQNQGLDQLAEKATKAERATDGLAGSQGRANTATGKMQAELLRAVQAIERATMEMRDLQLGLLEGAAAAMREAGALGNVSAAANTATSSLDRAAKETVELAGAANTATAALAQGKWRM